MKNVLSTLAATIDRVVGGYGPLHSRPKGYRTIHRLNRSQNWRSARSYTHARSISPYPDRPVR